MSDPKILGWSDLDLIDNKNKCLLAILVGTIRYFTSVTFVGNTYSFSKVLLQPHGTNKFFYRPSFTIQSGIYIRIDVKYRIQIWNKSFRIHATSVSNRIYQSQRIPVLIQEGRNWPQKSILKKIMFEESEVLCRGLRRQRQWFLINKFFQWQIFCRFCHNKSWSWSGFSNSLDADPDSAEHLDTDPKQWTSLFACIMTLPRGAAWTARGPWRWRAPRGWWAAPSPRSVRRSRRCAGAPARPCPGVTK